MNTLLEPPSYLFSRRPRAVLMHAKHPVFRPQISVSQAFSRSVRRALPCLAF
jgi:hypothetical protein